MHTKFFESDFCHNYLKNNLKDKPPCGGLSKPMKQLHLYSRCNVEHIAKMMPNTHCKDNLTMKLVALVSEYALNL